MPIIHQLLNSSENIRINGDYSSSDEETPLEGLPSCDPCREKRFWISIEFVMSLVQIIAAIVVLTQAKGEHQETTWIIGYTCGCIATLPMLCWRFWDHHDVISEIRINAVVDIWSMILEYFFVGWFVLFVLVFLIGKSSSSSLDYTTQLFGLCMAFLAFGCIRYVLPNLICAVICLCLPVALCINCVWCYDMESNELY